MRQSDTGGFLADDVGGTYDVRAIVTLLYGRYRQRNVYLVLANSLK
jgi:hypothetical protein